MSEDCTADIEHYLSRTGQFIMNAVVPIIAGTIFWTLYLVSVVLTAGVLWRKGFDRARTALLGLLLMMFILETLTFALSLFTFFQQTREILLMGIFEGDSLIRVQYPIETINAINQPIFLLMLITGDCIVIWRAYAVWTRSKLIMIIPVIFLLGFFVDFPFFVHCNFRHRRDIVHGSEATYCFATNTSALILSFSANISATLTIFYMAWTYYASQRILRVQSGALPSQTSSKVARILLLLVESGFVYFLIMTFSIAISSWRVPAYAPSTVIVYTLGAITSHCIGMVPTLTVFLVSVYGSFEDHHSTIDASQPIRFTSPRVTQSSYASAIRSLPSREPDVAETYDVVGPSGLSKESSETKL